MAKLTRHASIQALKAEASATRLPPAAREQAHAAFKAFVDLLQHARRQKPSTSDER